MGSTKKKPARTAPDGWDLFQAVREAVYQLTPVRVEVARPKAYLVTVLVGLGEREPWEAGWIPRSQLRGDPGYEEGDLDLMEIPMWLIRDKGWHLPQDEPEPETTPQSEPEPPATDLTLEELRAAGIEVTLILPGDIL